MAVPPSAAVERTPRLSIIITMKRRAIFFDRDNTLIACDGYLGDPAKVVLVEGAAEAIARARRLGYATVVVSNQSGVARGMFDEAAVHAVNARLDELLEEQDPAAVIDRHEFCPYLPDAAVEKYRRDSDLRKPKPGMILCAADKLALDLGRSWVIGDAPRDIEAGKAAGCRTILFQAPTLAASPAALAAAKVKPDYVCSSLSEALDYVEQNPPSNAEEHDEEAAPAPLKMVTPVPNASPRPPSPMGEGGGEGAGGRKVAAVREDASDAARDAAGPRPPATSSPPPGAAPAVARPASAAPPAPAAKPVAPASTKPPTSAQPVPAPVNLERLESLAEEILHELKRRDEQSAADFSVSKLLAGIVQVTALAVLFLAYLNRDNPVSLLNTLVFALTLQTLTIALLVMSRQR